MLYNLYEKNNGIYLFVYSNAMGHTAMPYVTYRCHILWSHMDVICQGHIWMLNSNGHIWVSYVTYGCQTTWSHMDVKLYGHVINVKPWSHMNIKCLNSHMDVNRHDSQMDIKCH